MTRVRSLSWWDRLVYTATGWRTFTLPTGDRVDCWKDRRRVPAGSLVDADWAHMADQVIDGIFTRVRSDGVGGGTPMQNGTADTRALWWGGGYGKHESFRATIPRVIGRYWITGYPTPSYDRRCIVAGPDGDVHEMIQFDQDAPRRAAGLAQQALGYGRWRDGQLVEGRAVTASGLPGSGYIWGPGSVDKPHCQSLVVDDYVGADGHLDHGPVVGGWYALDPTTLSYRSMVSLGGECAARAVALAVYGVRVIDRNGRRTADDGPYAAVDYEPGPAKLQTQAGAWCANTNLHLWHVRLADLRRVAVV